MENGSINRKELFILREISLKAEGLYEIKLSRSGQVISTDCIVAHRSDSKIGPFDFLQFKSDEFNNLCASGDIYLKPISKVIFAFHECLHSN